MEYYDSKCFQELKAWQTSMQKRPGILDRLSKALQNRINRVIPERLHKIITVAIKKMVQTVMFGAKFITTKPISGLSLNEREQFIDIKAENYKKTAATEGFITGAGGILLGIADFPILITIKIKFLFDVAAIYGYNVKDYRERLYLLYVFQIAFSSQKRRQEIYNILSNWKDFYQNLPTESKEFDWRTFQQEYRDYLDIAKLAQLIPIIGAPIGAYTNYKLMNQLTITAKNAYRMRYFEQQLIGN